jgi:hypothetical protein
MSEFSLWGSRCETRMRCGQSPPMTPDTTQVLIEIDPGSDPITGALRQHPVGDRQRFNGWLQLAQALETIRRSAIQAPPPDNRPQTTNGP